MAELLKYQKGLTKEQIDFLQTHKVHPRFIFDASGLSKVQYRPIMKELNRYIAFNTTACKQLGHTLRTRAGHCCQCNTASMAFQKRNDSDGVVYVAGTLVGQVVKIGFTESVDKRLESLNRTKYAGFSDWEILFAVSSSNAGRIETKANVLLGVYEYPVDYLHDGHWQDAVETYRCSLSKAKEIIQQVCLDNSFTYSVILDNNISKYDFKNFIKKVK